MGQKTSQATVDAHRALPIDLLVLSCFIPDNNAALTMCIKCSHKNIEQLKWFISEIQTLSHCIDTVLSSSSSEYKFSIQHGLIHFGELLQFTMVNRDPSLHILFMLDDNIISQFVPSLVPHPSPQGIGINTVNPSTVIRIFHVHAHFTTSTEPVALSLHKELIKYMKSEDIQAVKHQRVWYEKNGPHDKWSWEIHVKDPLNLARAVLFIALNRQLGMYYPVHCRTYDGDNKMNEYNDHAFRLGWIGSKDDEVPLDIDFFLS
jgi:aromatic ring-cleaving dioxygenase